MNIKFKILSKDPETHSIVVRYFSDVLTEEMLSANEMELRDVPHPQDPNTMVPRWFPKLREDGSPLRCLTDTNIVLPIPHPQGEALKNYISEQCNFEFFLRKEAILDPEIDTSMKKIDNLIGQTFDANIQESGSQISNPFEDLIHLIT